MDHFDIRGGVMHAEGVNLDSLADAVGTPFYCYSSATIERHFQVFADAVAGLGDGDPLVAFAVKANPNLSVLATLARLGAGADVVSGGEMARALAAGVPANRIVFSGVGKQPHEMAAGIEAGILQFNVESEAEIGMLAAVAAAHDARVDIAIRVNPAVNPGTHAKISTGGQDSKFGIPIERAHAAFVMAAGHASLNPVGLAAHIGSQLTDLSPIESCITRLGELAQGLRGAGHGVSRIDVGGGLGVPYRADQPAPPLPSVYAEMVARATRGWDCRLIFEPGRMIVGNAGVMVAGVILVKQGTTKTFVVTDAGMNDLLRPSLYGAWHDIRALRPRGDTMVATVVGPVCESGDTFAEDRTIEAVGAGDRIAFMTAGAYGATMASTYNSRPLVPEVMVKGDAWSVVSERNQPAAMLALDARAPWL
ncbi:diaminopimelate decarboxylase [Polymorphobacter fuscus]|uniref:Diaminopimelate decarboxylase n=1 Tax=Sandarakinorhabdus fusca TaxID=1439888 RepID=A0A7C9GNJ4_9SPHN|nr:diaminopimelate decarboxylase [Polymorphobacter fuscus]KAB7647552.1 diaminopimelate decarboxylase [Polymorphobacter fuscus]MQT16815.1 diaminopimelate decarboxylase [Polymorphobacter fuscus]NJC09196.1 diaminopimelate decarboxylase [Polymorphobacter fuscus]